MSARPSRPRQRHGTASRSSRVSVSSPWRALARAVSWHRRGLAAVAAGLAVLTGVSAALPAGPPTVAVVTVTDELAGGTVLAADDVQLREVRRSDIPHAVLTDPAAVLGRTLAGPAARGQMLTELALVSSRAGPAPGRVVAPVRLADADLAALLRPGDLVDVIAADGPEGGGAAVVAHAVRVVTVPAAAEDSVGQADGALVLVEVATATATALARAGAVGALTVTWR